MRAGLPASAKVSPATTAYSNDMLAAILMSYQGHEEKNVLAPGTAATILGKYMRLTPPTGLVQRVLKMARAIVIGEAVAELKRMPSYIKRANVLGHQITMKTCKGVEIKKRVLDDAKKVHNEKRKRLLEKGKSPWPHSSRQFWIISGNTSR